MAAIDRVFVQYYIIKRGSTTPGGAVTHRPRCLINVFFFNKATDSILQVRPQIAMTHLKSVRTHFLLPIVNGSKK